MTRIFSRYAAETKLVFGAFMVVALGLVLKGTGWVPESWVPLVRLALFLAVWVLLFAAIRRYRDRGRHAPSRQP